MKIIDGKEFSRKEFPHYEIRVIVKFNLSIQDEEIITQIFTTETDRYKIRRAINDTLNRKLCSTFDIIHYSTKKDDDINSRFLSDIMKIF